MGNQKRYATNDSTVSSMNKTCPYPYNYSIQFSTSKTSFCFKQPYTTRVCSLDGSIAQGLNFCYDAANQSYPLHNITVNM
jgi:hypothetical protein